MVNQDRTPPQSLQAEASLLGAALLSPEALGKLITLLDPQDFYSPAYRSISMAMLRMWQRGERVIDPVLVADELENSGDLDRVGGSSVLVSLMADTPATSNAESYAKVIQEKATQRQLLSVGHRIIELSYDEPDLTRSLIEARSLVEHLSPPMGSTTPSLTGKQFMDRQTPQDWIVPGLLERGDRLILTASEGGGKSMLSYQLAVQMASGIQPFRAGFYEPLKVLIVDLENSDPQTQRRLNPLFIKAGDNYVDENFRIEMKPEGLDLTERHDARWLIEKVAVNRPDVLFIGPIYKLHNDDPKDEQPARRVARVFDEIRARYGTALFIEAHTPKGKGNRTLEPYGASLWMRWPEFGYGIRKLKAGGGIVYSFDAWRGQRDIRDWPEQLRRGGEWPWSAEVKQDRAF